MAPGFVNNRTLLIGESARARMKRFEEILRDNDDIGGKARRVKGTPGRVDVTGMRDLAWVCNGIRNAAMSSFGYC